MALLVMPKRRDTEDTRAAVEEWVLHRLREECLDPDGTPKRGAQARIHRETGFTTAHISHLVRSARGAGDAFVHAYIRYLGLTYADAERQAIAWARTQPSTERALTPAGGLGRLGDQAGWHEALAEALKHRPPHIDERYYMAVAKAVVPGHGQPTPALVAKLAEMLYGLGPLRDE